MRVTHNNRTLIDRTLIIRYWFPPTINIRTCKWSSQFTLNHIIISLEYMIYTNWYFTSEHIISLCFCIRRFFFNSIDWSFLKPFVKLDCSLRIKILFRTTVKTATKKREYDKSIIDAAIDWTDRTTQPITRGRGSSFLLLSLRARTLESVRLISMELGRSECFADEMIRRRKGMRDKKEGGSFN